MHVDIATGEEYRAGPPNQRQQQQLPTKGSSGTTAKNWPYLGQLQTTPSHCLGWGGGHLHKERPEKTNENSTPSSCNCTQAEVGTPQPSNYRGCSHAEVSKEGTGEESPGIVFSSRYTTPPIPFTTAVRRSQQLPEELHSQPQPAQQVTT